MKLLPPQRLRPSYYAGVEESIDRFFRAFLFDPVVELLAQVTPLALEVYANAAPVDPALRDALREGRVQYVRGKFVGDFDAATSRALRDLGATLDLRDGTFTLAQKDVPAWVKAEAVAAQRRAENIHAAIRQKLEEAKVRLDLGQLELPIEASEPIGEIELGFKSAADALGIPVRIAPAARRAMETAYATDVRPYVVKATAQYIDELHADVARNAAAGYRYDHLVEDLQARYHTTRSKARFLARQETSLFMSSYRRERFTAAGVRRYNWSNSHDARVRPAQSLTAAQREHAGNHRVLDGQTFYYDRKAPARFMSSKQPCNPGEDFGCRCVDLARVEP